MIEAAQNDVINGMHIEQQIIEKLCTMAEQYSLQKIVLFGSRARGIHHPYSDIDLAVWGISNADAYFDFQEAVEEQIPTLLRFDIVDMSRGNISDALREEIAKDGATIYEKI